MQICGTCVPFKHWTKWHVANMVAFESPPSKDMGKWKRPRWRGDIQFQYYHDRSFLRLIFTKSSQTTIIQFSRSNNIYNLQFRSTRRGTLHKMYEAPTQSSCRRYHAARWGHNPNEDIPGPHCGILAIFVTFVKSRTCPTK